uniref:Uncharacterized protein n=1 Tax=Peronospora matthiolae TaxID=2874970 RepID=A0AAV1UCY9_9STRA
MDAGNARMHAAISQETARLWKVQPEKKKDRYKAGLSQTQTKVGRLRDALAALVVEINQRRDDLADLEVDRDRLRSFLDDGDDQVCRLQNKISNQESEHDLALCDRDALRASIASFSTSICLPIFQFFRGGPIPF